MTNEQENNFNIFCDYILKLIEEYGVIESTEEEGTD